MAAVKTFTRWPHQERALNEVTERLTDGAQSICLTSPTGAGKSLIIGDLTAWAVNRGMKVVLYTNRKLLTENLADKFEEYGIPFGVQAAGYEAWTDLAAPVQICSIQTQHARVHQRREKTWHDDRSKLQLPDADLVIRDEAHIKDRLEVTNEHRAGGAQYVGVTATPLGINDQFDELIVAGTKAELFGYNPPCLIPAHMSAIQEMDTSKVKRKKDGEYIVNKQVRELWTSHIVGSVRANYLSHGMERPFLGFAFGVPESKHHCKDFCDNGIPCAHVDGENVYVDGTEYKSDREAVADVFHRLRDGKLNGVWNRFKLREGLDLPFVSYLILACPIGSLLSYVQVVGRLLRYHPSVDEQRIQDHGGNWWKHPSPNSDIDWQACWNIPVNALSGAREAAVKDGTTSPGWACPKCGECHKRAPDKCRNCGFEPLRGTPIRRVVEENGDLKEVEGFPQKHKPKMTNGTQKMWERIYWGAKKNKPNRTFGQCWAWFCKKHWDEFHCQPPKNLPLMPREHLFWYKPVSDVSMDKLIGGNRGSS